MLGPVATAISIDGRIVDPANATISVLDRGLLYGDGAFEVLRTWGGVAVDLPAHLDRLYATVAAMGLRTMPRAMLEVVVERTLAATAAPQRGATDGADVPRPSSATAVPHPSDAAGVEHASFGAAILHTPGAKATSGVEGEIAVEPTPGAGVGERTSSVIAGAFGSGPGAAEHRIRIVLTRGPGGLGAETASLGPGRAIVIVEPLGAQPAEVSAAIVDWSLPRRVGTAHKTLAYLDHVIARDLARAAGADEGIRLDALGRAVEGATSNLFAVVAGAVVTAPTEVGVLPGIVRGRVLAACGREGIRVREEALAVDELRAAAEVFVSSSLRGVVPVTRLDGVARAAGPITARIAECVGVEMHRLAALAAGRRV